MVSPKTNPKQAKGTVKTSRIGKKKRAEIIEAFRPRFERELSAHLESYQKQSNRLELDIWYGNIPDLIIKDGGDYKCHVCGVEPYDFLIQVHPCQILEDKEVLKYLRELGFDDDFVKLYVEEFRNEKKSIKEKRKSAWGIRNIGGLIRSLVGYLKYRHPWLTLTATASILEDLFTEKGYTPGEGTIKKRIKEGLPHHFPSSTPVKKGKMP